MNLVPTKIHGWDDPVMLPESVLVKNQKRKLNPVLVGDVVVIPEARWDDCCGNGHNSFAITANIFSREVIRGEDAIMHCGKKYWCCGGGCRHDMIAKSHPKLARLIKWHLCSSDGPTHYLANTAYHALEHGPKAAWVYLEDKAHNIGRTCVKHGSIEEMEVIWASNPELYSVVIDQKTAKEKNLDHARSSACWPEATDEQLSLPPDELKALLIARLPAMMVQMYQDITNFGFTY